MLLFSQIDRHKGRKDPQSRIFNLLMLDMLAEAGRNPAIAKIVRKNSAMLRGLMFDLIQSGQVRGQIDPGLDAGVAAGMLLSVMDGMRTLPIRYPDADIGRSLDMLKTLIARFLSPPKKP